MKTLRRLFSNINYLNLFATIIGSAIVAFGTAIHVDSGAADGGIIGIARLIEHFTDGKIEIWLSSLLINAFCYLLAWRLMDAKFILNMGVGTLTYSLFVKLLEPVNLDLGEYVLLATLLGMILIEVGTGLMLRYGSAPNGEHVLSLAIAKKGEFDFGWLHFIKDFIIILLFLPVTDLESVIYSLILMTLTTPIMDFIVTAPKKASITQSMSKKKGKWIPIFITGLVLIIALSASVIYLGHVYKADTEEIYSYNISNIDNVKAETLDDGVVAYVPNIPEEEIKSGLVFYPGARVEYTAYEPLLKKCAERGIVCIVVRMPQNLAIFGINKGVDVIKHFPAVENWYIGGHSLGGSMAALCASNNTDIFKGVVLLASYSTADISDLEVLSVYGSMDGVMNKNKYEKNKDNLPDDFIEYEIKGGNHAYFGMYGTQDGDKEAIIKRKTQINDTAKYIADFILSER